MAPPWGRPVPGIGSVFTIMKKNDIKTGSNKPPEVKTREQLEDRAFNRMLLWLAAVAVVEVVMVIINRFYIHTRAGEIAIKLPLYNTLTVFPIVGVVLFALCMLWVRKRRSQGLEYIAQLVLGVGLLAMGLFGFVMRGMNATTAPMVLAVVPGLGVLIMVFYLYQKEFLGCAIVGALGLLGLWVYRVYTAGTLYYAYLVFTLVVALIGVALAVKLKGSDGIWKYKGKEVAIVQPDASYLPYYLTVVVTAVLLLAPLFLGAAVAYYAIWVMAAWLFILAVYFTSKLM